MRDLDHARLPRHRARRILAGLVALATTGCGDAAPPSSDDVAPPCQVSPQLLTRVEAELQGELVVVGDSITHGVPHSYRYPLTVMLAAPEIVTLRWTDTPTPDRVAVNSRLTLVTLADESPTTLATPGATTGEMAEQVTAHLAAEPPAEAPAAVLIHLGTNDLIKTDVPTAVDSMTFLVDELFEAYPDTAVLVAEIIPAYDVPAHNVLAEELNARVRTLAAMDARVTAVDMYTGFYKAEHFIDLLHPSQAGATEMACRWIHALAPAK